MTKMSLLILLINIQTSNLWLYWTCTGVNLCDENLHVYEPLDGSNNGGDDLHRLPWGNSNAVHLTWGWQICHCKKAT